MADIEEKRISDLPRATEVSSDTLFETAIPDSTSETGFVSKGAGLEDIAEDLDRTRQWICELRVRGIKKFDEIAKKSKKYESLARNCI